MLEDVEKPWETGISNGWNLHTAKGRLLMRLIVVAADTQRKLDSVEICIVNNQWMEQQIKRSYCKGPLCCHNVTVHCAGTLDTVTQAILHSTSFHCSLLQS